MKYSLLLISLFSVTVFANKYTNCTFQNTHYSDVCEKVVKNGVSYDYANRFLLSYFKVTKLDEKSWKYLNPEPKKITKNGEEEKKELSWEQKANLSLVKHIPEIVGNLRKYKAAYDFAEEKYGVNREIIAAILMKETRLGKIKPKHDAFIVFNTILNKIDKPKTKREKWLLNLGKTNMATVIEYCYEKKIRPSECNLPSSYAGAIGFSQFMPNSLKYAEGFTQETADLNNMNDAIVSIASFLHQKAGFEEMIDWKEIQNLPKVEKHWYAYSLENEKPSFVYEKSRYGVCYQCFSKDKPELDYLKHYMKKVMRYNNSSDYAIGVMRLAHDAQQLLKQKLIAQQN